MTFKNYKMTIWGTVLLILIIGIGISPSFSSSLDSLRTEQINGKLFIIHQIDQGETLYAISRRYKVSIPTIISYNQFAEQDLKIGTLIKIPLTNPIVKLDTIGMISHEVKPKETLFSLAREYNTTVSEIKSWNNLVTNELNIGQILYIKPTRIKSTSTVVQIDTTNKITHELKQGETFYSLSKRYGISIEQLKTWNDLQDNALSIGQLLIVGKKPMVTDIVPVVIENDILKDTVRSTGLGTPDLTDTTHTFKRGANINGFEEIIESGIGELIPGSTEKRKYLGFHHTAKIGTIMKVRNEMNDKMVFVRIIGRIPNTGDNQKVLLKISKAAYDRLGIIDKRFRVEISYMP